MDPQPFMALDAASARTADALDAEQNRVLHGPDLRGIVSRELSPEDARPGQDLVKDGDLELISAPIDFFGLNYYRPHYVRRGDWADLRVGEDPVGARGVRRSTWRRSSSGR